MQRLTNADLVNGSYPGSLALAGYAHPLPEGLARVEGWLDLRGYAQPLPAALAARDTRHHAERRSL